MPIATLLTFLPQFIAAGESLWAFVQHVREAAMQTSEWTQEHEDQFQAALMAQGQAPESLPDKE